MSERRALSAVDQAIRIVVDAEAEHLLRMIDTKNELERRYKGSKTLRSKLEWESACKAVDTEFERLKQ